MSIFKGKNRFKKIHNQLIYKSRFEVQAHEQEGPEVFEFNFIEYAMYGAIDLEGSSIYPNDMYIRNLRNSSRDISSYSALEFTDQMFIDTKRNIQLAVSIGELVKDNQIISNMEIKNAYEPPRGLYRTYLSGVLRNFNETIKSNKTILDSITSFDHYVKELMVFLSENYMGIPITFSSWLQSPYNSIFSSGLAVSVADIPFDEDDNKYENFMASAMFPFYKKVALNRGFRVWKHCPYVLVVDLMSPAITPYLNLDIETILDTYYKKAYDIDYILIYQNVIEYYNILLAEIPYKVKINIGCVNKSTKEIINREPKLATDIDTFFWLNYYLDLRNIELGMVKRPAQIRKIKKYLKNMQNRLDNSQIAGYIDGNFRKETFRKRFGLLHSRSRLNKKEKAIREKEGIIGGSTIFGGSSGGSSGY